MNDDLTDSIDPTSAATKEDLARYLRMLRIRADSPSYRDLEKMARDRRRSLSRTTLGDVLSGRRFPSKLFLLTFVELCGVNPAADPRWESAWIRLAVRYKASSSPTEDENGLAVSEVEPTSRALAAAVAGWHEIARELLAEQRWELAERAFRTLTEFCSAGGWDEETLASCRDGLSLAIAGQAEITTQSRIGLPPVWNVEPRNPEFTGRDLLLANLRERLRSGGAAVVQALRGMGGVGKTQLAIEYAHRFAADYDLAWWITAEDPALIGEQLTALALATGLVEAGADTASAGAVLKAHLRGTDRWLLIFDNAEDPARLREWLPGGPGHVVITSRTGGWEHIATMVPVDVMKRTESVRLLSAWRSDLSTVEADQLASALGDLPLALTQAGGFLATTSTTVSDYCAFLNDHAREVLTEGAAGDYPMPLAGAITLSMTRIATADPAGLAVLRLCSFLAPEAVAVDWLSVTVPDDPPGETLAALRQAAGNPLAIRRAVAAIVRLGLATSTRDGLRLHRLTAAIIRDQLTEEDRAQALAYARQVLTASAPEDPENPASWPQWARMVPHLLAVDPALGRDPAWRDLACDAAWYLIERGDSDASSRLAEDIIQGWNADGPPDVPHVLWAKRCLARARREQGRYTEARTLYEEALPVSRELLGPDHPHTLRLAHGFAIDLHLLGEHEQAYKIQRETHSRYRDVLGEDHPHTLHSANHLGVDLLMLGDCQQARELHEDTFARYRRVVGDDHPDTLRAANNLAVDLRTLRENSRARELQEDTLARRGRVLGENHPDTLYSATSLSETLQMMGLLEEARVLQQDALTRSVQVLGEQHPEAIRAARNLVAIRKAMAAADEDP